MVRKQQGQNVCWGGDDKLVMLGDEKRTEKTMQPNMLIHCRFFMAKGKPILYLSFIMSASVPLFLPVRQKARPCTEPTSAYTTDRHEVTCRTSTTGSAEQCRQVIIVKSF